MINIEQQTGNFQHLCAYNIIIKKYIYSIFFETDIIQEY